MTGPGAGVERLVWPLLAALRTDTAQQFGAAGRTPCRFPLVWGDARPPAEFCDCTCNDGHGAAWVRCVRLGPSALTRANSPADCGGLWSATVEIGVHRCDTTTLDEQGTPPDEDTVTAQAGALALDAACLRRAVRCSPFLDRWGIPWQVESVIPLGPTGGCVGAALTAGFELSESCDCPEVSTT